VSADKPLNEYDVVTADVGNNPVVVISLTVYGADPPDISKNTIPELVLLQSPVTEKL
jgi:hypothetical protein